MGGANELASRSLTSNKELQVYVDPAFAGTAKGPMGLNPFSVSNGILTIRAEKASPEVSSHVWGYGYTSGLLTTADSFSQTYGYFEVRARVPRGKGLWPAVWLLPADRTWPPEIDILESLGQDPDLIHQTVHWTKHEEHVLKHSETRISGADTAFHTYGMDWSKTTIRWFIDGKETARAPTPPDLHKPVYLLLNLAVGGWAGEPAQDAVPGEFQIDYVRVYGSRPPRKRPAKATD
jgi:beta-glucanase (GH16 family)